MRRFALRLLLSLAVAGVLLGALMLLGGVSPATALSAVGRLPPRIYVLALGLHGCTYLLRALRTNLLIPASLRPGFRRALVVSAAHNMASYVLPAKTGEAALVVYLRLHCGVSTAVGLAALLVSRFLDGAAMCVALSLACFSLHASGRYEGLHWLGTAGGLLAVLAAVFLVLCVRGDLLVRVVGRGLRWLRLHRWRRGEVVLQRLEALALALRGTGHGGRLIAPALATAPVWCSVFAFYLVLARAMGMPPAVSFPETAFGASLAGLANLLPLNGMAGVGTQELGWVAGFHRFLGVDYEVALATGVGVHLVQLANVVGMGLLAHLAMGVMPRLAYRVEETG